MDYYKSLYRVYRPKSFEDVIGQDHIVGTLKNIISTKKIVHAYLFSGPKGTGKTSVAHIFARALNGIDSSLVSKSLDIIEIDAASNNGVGEIRSLIDNIQYSPSEMQYKVYIIDEVHMMSKAAFNAFLKTLEEPPSYVIFILATTEMHKIPLTVLSRCQRFNFHRISNDDIIKRLTKILSDEKIAYEMAALKKIAALSHGSLRDALTFVEQAALFSQNQIELQTVLKIFGLVDHTFLIKLLNQTFECQTTEVIKKIDLLSQEGVDYERFASLFIELVKEYIIYQKTSEPKFLQTFSLPEITSLVITLDFAYEALEVLLKLVSELHFSDEQSQTLEICFLKLLQLGKKFCVESKTTSETPYRELVQDLSQSLSNTAEFEIDYSKLPNHHEQKKAHEVTKDEGETMKLFDLKKQSVVEKKLDFDTSSNDFFINLLLNSNQVELQKCKLKWDKVLLTGTNPRFTRLAFLLNDTKVISASDSFVLVGTESEEVLSALEQEWKNVDLIELLTNLLGNPRYLFILSKERFKKIKALWANLSQNNALPPLVKIEPPQTDESSTSDAQNLGNAIFGNIFETNNDKED